MPFMRCISWGNLEPVETSGRLGVASPARPGGASQLHRQSSRISSAFEHRHALPLEPCSARSSALVSRANREASMGQWFPPTPNRSSGSGSGGSPPKGERTTEPLNSSQWFPLVLRETAEPPNHWVTMRLRGTRTPSCEGRASDGRDPRPRGERERRGPPKGSWPRAGWPRGWPAPSTQGGRR